MKSWKSKFFVQYLVVVYYCYYHYSNYYYHNKQLYLLGRKINLSTSEEKLTNQK